MNTAAADIFIQVAEQAILERKRMLVALSGGRTSQGLFQVLASPAYRPRVPWSQIHFFWCDERLVPPDHVESNVGQAHKLLFSRVNVLHENLHRIHGEYPPAQAVEQYRKELELFKVDDIPWPRFDLAFLGLGADGHTASLFPGPINPEEQISPVAAVTANYQGRPAGRITLTPLALNTARNLVFLVTGKEKAKAVANTLWGPKDLDNWPAQRIHPVDGKLYWLLDEQAATF